MATQHVSMDAAQLAAYFWARKAHPAYQAYQAAVAAAAARGLVKVPRTEVDARLQMADCQAPAERARGNHLQLLDHWAKRAPGGDGAYVRDSQTLVHRASSPGEPCRVAARGLAGTAELLARGVAEARRAAGPGGLGGMADHVKAFLARFERPVVGAVAAAERGRRQGVLRAIIWGAVAVFSLTAAVSLMPVAPFFGVAFALTVVAAGVYIGLALREAWVAHKDLGALRAVAAAKAAWQMRKPELEAEAMAGHSHQD